MAVNNKDDALNESDLPLKYLITLAALIWSTAAMSLEEPKYTILKQTAEYEISERGNDTNKLEIISRVSAVSFE